MRAFWIFAIALTVAYIIYYCVIIAKDLARPREQVSSDEETFELADTAPEPSKVVAMTDKGFQVQDGFGNASVPLARGATCGTASAPVATCTPSSNSAHVPSQASSANVNS